MFNLNKAFLSTLLISSLLSIQTTHPSVELSDREAMNSHDALLVSALLVLPFGFMGSTCAGWDPNNAPIRDSVGIILATLCFQCGLTYVFNHYTNFNSGVFPPVYEY